MKRILLTMIGLSVFLFADFARDNAVQIVTDTTTGLQWQDDVNITKTWTEAIDYCESLVLGGHDDWRLPNFDELNHLADRSKSHPAIDPAFINVVPNNYWSSTSLVGSADKAWYVNFRLGYILYDVKSHNGYDVRCVRAGE